VHAYYRYLRRDSATPHFYGYDRLSVVHLLTDRAGLVTDQYEYEAFGGLLWQTGSTPNPHRFTGERFSSDLGLYYLRARWYNQGTGRFLTRDTYPLNAHHPIEWNRYVYTANNPVNAVDPSGHQLVGQVVVQEATTKKTRSLHAHQKGVQHARFLRYKRLGGSRAADAKRIQIRLRNSLSSDMDMKGVTIGRANSGGTKLISVSTDKAHIIQRLQTQNPGYEVIHPGHAFFRSRG
jgi:RHS repeat-associated protein